ncbi:S41 family peptidase [Paenibacillus sp. OAS669]|uniref:S41 family peptidase n=1 Tax=Paenibacillus sp. OAS669 TaxID=2663821 RepID=UPI0017892E0D|nr:S41 family peptidase [Paenibacillus sp. OAS669]MBE1445825.1 carboxyl-terminal processing protease [Paenibacillus sp. OAS669]
MSLWGMIDSVKWFTVYDLLISIITIGVLIWYSVPIRVHYRWLDFMPSVGMLLVAASIISGDLDFFTLSNLIYLPAVIVFLCTVKKVFKPTHTIRVPKYRALRVILCVCAAAPIGLGLTVAGELRYNPTSHFGNMSYASAFVKMNERLSVEYPFGEWKKIDWNALRQKYEPIFQQADSNKDRALYVKTLKEYVCSIHDGHVTLYNEEDMKKEVGGSFGIGIIRLDDGSVFVRSVVSDSTAAQNEIKVGAEIVNWDRKNGKDALQDLGCTMTSTATEQGKINNQELFMTRGPVGKTIEVGFKNWGEQETKTATLTAFDDQFKSLRSSASDSEPITGKLLDNGYGYVKITAFPSDPIGKPEKPLEDLLKLYQKEQAKGLILDLRDNKGGEDDLVAIIAGYFVPEKKLYEYTSYYNRYMKKFEINRNETRMIKPASNVFTGKIAVLINSRTVSSGEGLPLVMKGMPNVKLIGFTGTNGSFGIVSSRITINMPEGYSANFPDGRSLNKDKQIQVDSNYTGQGGVAPDIRVPLTRETFKQVYIDGQDVLLNEGLRWLAN